MKVVDLLIIYRSAYRFHHRVGCRADWKVNPIRPFHVFFLVWVSVHLESVLPLSVVLRPDLFVCSREVRTCWFQRRS